MLPVVGFLLSFLLFAAIGARLLKRRSGRPPRARVVIAFALASQASALLFAWAYGALFADRDGTLHGPIAIYGLLIGLVVVGAVGGYAVATRLRTSA
jgi:hypothetical protein